jgi:hypothetical protein
MIYGIIFLTITYLTMSYFGCRLNRVHNIVHLPLIDIFHNEQFKFMSKYYNLSDYTILPCVVLLCYFNERVNTFLWVQGVINLLRCISFSITILPKPGLHGHKDPSRNLWQITWDYFSFKDKHVGFNNDLMFSGHVSLLVSVCIHMTYFYPAWIILNIVLWLITLVTSFLIIVSRCHYTIDVIYAYIIPCFIFQNMVIFMNLC